MEHYDPELAPDAHEWLALDEAARIVLAENFHRDARISIPRAGRRLHAYASIERLTAKSWRENNR